MFSLLYYLAILSRLMVVVKYFFGLSRSTEEYPANGTGKLYSKRIMAVQHRQWFLVRQ